MNTVKLVDYDLVKEIRRCDKMLILVGIAGYIFWTRLNNLEKYVKGLKDVMGESADDWDEMRAFYKTHKEKSKED